MRDQLEFLLLGQVEARAGGRPLRLGGPRQRALLALLLLQPGRPVAAGLLAEELWEGSPPAGAETTLRSYASRLRSALGADAVETRGGGYALVAAPQQVDASRFEELLREGREAQARGAAGLASERLHAALGLWRGAALQDARAGGALAREAQRLDELRLVCLEERIDADLALGRHAELVAELQALVAEEPLRERLRRQLVLALYRGGRQAAALEAYRDARRMLDEELGLEPGEELRELERAILRQEVAPVAAAEARHNLPAPTTSFVGRGRELGELAELLRAHRLVTLTGLGGAGKTRLALEAGRRQVEASADGVWLVELTALADAELVPVAVAETLGVAERSRERVLDALLAHARTRELLLVLDNCEHLAAASGELADALLRGCPNLRILATSRVPLAVPGEVDYALDPLAAEPSAQLFLERAAAVRRGLADDEEAAGAVAAICRELDGLPLAIELAAARAKALSLDEIAARLDDRFRFLRAWQRVADPRHRTLETTMDWSYDLLAEPERQLLRRLAVFAGGAELAAVVEICCAGGEDEAVELLARLVDASLVRAEGGSMRYRLLETVRQYAAARLADDPSAEEVRRRHALHYLRLAESANLSVEAVAKGEQRHEPVLREQHNLRAALDWAAERDVEVGLRIAVALENFWVTQATAEGAAHFERLLVEADGLDVLLRARATRDHAACLDVSRDFDRARELYERSRALFAEAGDEVGVAALDFRLGVIAISQHGDIEGARRIWERCLETFRAHGDVSGVMQVLGNLGSLELELGDEARGRAMYEEGLAMAREAGWWWWLARGRADMAATDAAAGRVDLAEPNARESLEFWWRTGNRQEALHALAVLARVAALRGDDERALTLWSSVEAVEDGESRFGAFDRSEYDAVMPRGPRPEPLPLEDAVALALGG